MPHIPGEHITLRDYHNDDIPSVHEWANDLDTVRYLSARYWMPQSQTDAADFVDHAMRAGTNGAYLGQIDLYSINWRLRSAEMAIVLGREAARGRGIGGEAVGLLLRYAFTMLGLERVELEVAAENERAIRCYKRAGFQVEGVKRHAFMVDGKYTDLVVMGVLSGDWRSAHAGVERE